MHLEINIRFKIHGTFSLLCEAFQKLHIEIVWMKCQGWLDVLWCRVINHIKRWWHTSIIVRINRDMKLSELSRNWNEKEERINIKYRAQVAFLKFIYPWLHRSSKELFICQKNNVQYGKGSRKAHIPLIFYDFLFLVMNIEKKILFFHFDPKYQRNSFSLYYVIYFQYESALSLNTALLKPFLTISFLKDEFLPTNQ